MVNINNEKKWTSLERANLTIDILSLVVSTLLTVLIFFYGNRIATSQWTNQKLVEKRIDLYDKIMPLLNDILCYQMLYGNFKELSPIEIVNNKRNLDKIFFTQKDFFSEAFQDEYHNFMNLCFKPYSGTHKDAKIRSNFKIYKESYTIYHDEIIKDNKKWVDDWNENFTNEPARNNKVEESYYKLMKVLVKEIGVENNIKSNDK